MKKLGLYGTHFWTQASRRYRRARWLHV